MDPAEAMEIAADPLGFVADITVNGVFSGNPSLRVLKMICTLLIVAGYDVGVRRFTKYAVEAPLGYPTAVSKVPLSTWSTTSLDAACPVPVNEIVAGDAGSLLVMVRLELNALADTGANRMVTVVDWPAAIVNDNAPSRLNPVPGGFSVAFSVPPPVLETTTERSLV